LDLREYWGVFGDRRSWRRLPRGVLARLKLLLFGFPALPHSRPRSKLTRLQEQQQQQQDGLAAAAAASGGVLAVQQQQQQQQGGQAWVPLAESAVEAPRSVASSLQEVRRLHPGAQQPVWQDLPQPSQQQQQQDLEAQQTVQQQDQVTSAQVIVSQAPQPQQQVQSSLELHREGQQQQQQHSQNQELRLQESGQELVAAAQAAGEEAYDGNGSSGSSSKTGYSYSNNGASYSSNGAALDSNGAGCSGSGAGMVDSPSSSVNGNGRVCPPANGFTPQLQQQPTSSSSCSVQGQLVQVVACGQQLQEQPLQQQQQESLVGALSSSAGSSNGNGSNIMPVLSNEGRLLQPAYQQQQQRQGLSMRAVPVAAAGRPVSELQSQS
jgi:hypothetical protein